MGKWDFLQPYDAQVQRALAAGNVAEAFEALLHGYQRIVVQFCTTYLGNAADGHDVAQDVFVALWRALPRYEQRGVLLRTWVFRIARNLCMKYQRRPLPPHAARDEPTPSPEDEYEAREDHAHAAHQHRRLERCLRRLPARERDLLMLYYYEELSFRAMAKRLWRPEATVRRAVHKAEHQLREYMTQKEVV